MPNMPRQYYPLENILRNPDPVQHDENGCWPCDVDTAAGDLFNFLEVHRSYAWDKWGVKDPQNRKIVFRISENIDRFENHEVRLGNCVMLGLEKVRELRDRLNEMLEECEKGA